MAGPSVQDMQEQVRQAQQNALASTASQQQPLHPMVAGGGGYAPSPILPQGTNSLGRVTPKGITVNLGKISLLAVCFSLMFFGIFTFLSGFLLGIWFAGPEQVSFVPEKKETPLLGLLPPEQQMQAPQMRSVPSQGGELPSSLKNNAGSITEDMVSNTTVSGVPAFLYPLVNATQSAAGKQLGHKVQQQVDRQSNASMPSTPQPQTNSPLNTQTQLPYQQPLSSPATSGPTHFPAVMPQRKQPAVPYSHERTNSLPHQEDEGYTIQLGVYAAKDNADALVNHMQALNYTSHIIEGKAPDGSTLYYVHSGLYKDYNAALDTASRFAAQNIPGAIVVKISKNDKGLS